MSIDLYCTPFAPTTPVIVQLATRLGVKVNQIITDVHKGEAMTPEFLKMNPQHCVPTIVDDGFILWESRAIYGYLANSYDKSGKLYPADPKKRAKVDQKLQFDIGVLYQRLGKYYLAATANVPLDPESKEDGLVLLEDDLGRHVFAAGDDLTIADYAIAASVGCFDAAGVPLEDYPNITRWRKELDALGVGIPKDTVDGLKKIFTKKE